MSQTKRLRPALVPGLRAGGASLSPLDRVAILRPAESRKVSVTPSVASSASQYQTMAPLGGFSPTSRCSRTRVPSGRSTITVLPSIPKAGP
jgi:hypothetical protein